MIRFILTGGHQYTEDSFHVVHKTLDVDCPELEEILLKDRTFKYLSGAEIIKKCPACDRVVPVGFNVFKDILYVCSKCGNKWNVKE